MVECPAFKHEEHTADVLVVGVGRTLEEAFEQAAIGVYEVVTDTAQVWPERRIDVDIESEDLESLLYKWIEELLVYTDSEGLVFGIIKVCRIIEGQGKYKIVASAWGEPFDPDRHEQRTIVKAMTYAQMEIKKEEDCWRVQFVVDI